MRDFAGIGPWIGLWIGRRLRAQATAEILRRLDRRLLDDIGISPATIAEAAERAARATELQPSPVQGSRG